MGLDYSSVVLQPAEKWFHGQEKGSATKAVSMRRRVSVMEPPKIESWGRFDPTNRPYKERSSLGLGLASFSSFASTPRMEWSETSRRAIRLLGLEEFRLAFGTQIGFNAGHSSEEDEE